MHGTRLISNMTKQILLFALTMACVSQVCSKDQEEVSSGMFVVSSKGTTRTAYGLSKENKTEVILSLQNNGDLVDGMINTNISKSNKLNSAFKKIKKIKFRTECNIFEYPLFVIKFCHQEDSKEIPQHEAPKGSYKSKIQIIQNTFFFNGVWTLRFRVLVEYDVKMFDTNKYTTCSRDEMMKSLKKFEAMNGTKGNEISNNKNKASEVEETTTNKKGEVEAKRHNNKKEVHDSNKPEPGVSLIKATKKYTEATSPIFIKIKVRPTRKLEDLKEGDNLYYTFFDFKTECVIIKAGKFKSEANSNKTIINITRLNLVIEASATNGVHTYLLYDSRFKFIQLEDQDTTDKANYIEVTSNCDASEKITMEKTEKGTTFSFDLTNKTDQKLGKGLDHLLVYVSNEQKKGHSVVTAVKKHKVSVSGCFHIKAESNNKVIPGYQIETLERIRKVDCNVSQTVIEKWLMDDIKEIEPQCLRNKNARHQVVKPKKLPAPSSKMITCGILSIEISRGNKYDSILPIPNNVFAFFMKARKRMNENGKQLGEDQKNEKKLKKRKLFPKDEKNCNLTYETLELMAPVFEKNVQESIADLKKSLSAKHGKSIWKTADYKSELKIVRKVTCSDQHCQGSIKAVLQYNLTKKAELYNHKFLTPKRNFKLLRYIRIQFKVVKPYPLLMALLKRKPNNRPEKIPMPKIRQAVNPIHPKKKSLKKVIPEGSQQILHFKATGTRSLLSKMSPSLGKDNKIKEYQQKMAKENIPIKSKNPFFQVVNEKNIDRYLDGEINYDVQQQREAFKKAQENEAVKKLTSGLH